MFGISGLNAAHHKLAKTHHGHEHRGRDGRFHGRYNRAGAVTSGSAAERMTYFAGKKAGEAGAGIALGAMQAYGDPLFFSSDPTKAMGPKLLGSIVFSIAEVIQLWKGWSFGRVFGEKAGCFVDGTVSGLGSGCWSVWTFDNSNTYFAAKIEQANSAAGGTGTKGVDYTAERRRLHAPQASGQLPVGRAAESAAQQVRRQEFQGRMSEAEAVGARARQAMAPFFAAGRFD